MSQNISPDPANAGGADPLVTQFKSGMRHLAAGVSLIATRHEDQPYGLVVTSVSSLTAEPPTLLVCVNHSASAHDPIGQSGCFSVNVLASEAVDIARAFSDPERRAERFIEGQWTRLATGAPILAEALVAFDCKVSAAIPHGTHTIFIGTVLEVRVNEGHGQPLVYFNRAFHELVLGRLA